MPVWFHEILTPLMMLMVFALNIVTSFRRADRKSEQEAQRLEAYSFKNWPPSQRSIART